jgi:hypothetical protein
MIINKDKSKIIIVFSSFSPHQTSSFYKLIYLFKKIKIIEKKSTVFVCLFVCLNVITIINIILIYCLCKF